MRSGKSVQSYFSYSMIYFFYFFALGIFGSMLSVYLTGNEKSPTEISFIVSGAGIFSMVAGPFLGVLYDRTGWRKKLSLIQLAASAVSGALFALTQNTALLFLLNGLAMSFLNSINPVCEQIASASPYRYGVLRLWGAIGYAASNQLAGIILEGTISELIFILFAVTALLTGAAFQWTGLQDSAPSAKKRETRETGANPTVPLILFAVFCFFFSGSTNASGTYVPVLLERLLGGASLAGTMLFIATLMEIPVIFLSNRFMDRLNGRQLLVINTVLLLIQYAAYSYVGNIALLCAIMIVTKSVTTMLFIMVSLKVVLTLTEGKYATTVLSVIATVKSLGGVVLTNLAGGIIDRWDLHTVFPVLLGVAAVLLVFSFFIRIPSDEKSYFAG